MVPNNEKAVKWCMFGWLERYGLDEDGALLQQIDRVIHASFPERTDEHASCEGQITEVNDHPPTVYADVCKILDEANRRLA